MIEKKIHNKRIFEYFFSGASIALVLLFIVFFLFYFEIIPAPSFLSNIFLIDNGEVDSSYYDESEFYRFLEKSGDNETEIKTLSITIENAADFIKALKTDKNFYWELETVDFYKSSSYSSSHSVWSRDLQKRIDTVSQYQNSTTVIDSEKTVVRNNKSGDTRTFEGDTDFTFESAINIADVEFYIDSQDSVMREASLMNTETQKYLYVSFYNETLDKTDEFYISLDYGIVLFSESYINSEKVFTQTTKDFRPDYKSEDGIFKI